MFQVGITFVDSYQVISLQCVLNETIAHDDIIKWKHFSHNWPFVRETYRSPVDSPYKGQWRAALMFSLIFAWTNGSANNLDAGDLRCHRAHYDAIVMGVLQLEFLRLHQLDCHAAYSSALPQSLLLDDIQYISPWTNLNWDGSWYGNTFNITGPLWGGSIGHWSGHLWIPLTEG